MTPTDPTDAELSVQGAAALLWMGEAFFITQVLEAGHVAVQGAGSERRVRREELLAYWEEELARRRRIADELTREAQELGLL